MNKVNFTYTALEIDNFLFKSLFLSLFGGIYNNIWLNLFIFSITKFLGQTIKLIFHSTIFQGMFQKFTQFNFLLWCLDTVQAIGIFQYEVFTQIHAIIFCQAIKIRRTCAKWLVDNTHMTSAILNKNICNIIEKV